MVPQPEVPQRGRHRRSAATVRRMACRPNGCGSPACCGQESRVHQPQSRRLCTWRRLACLCSMERATVRKCTQKSRPTRCHTLCERSRSKVHRGRYIVVGSVRCSVIKQAVVRPRHHAEQTKSGCAQIKCWYLAGVVGHRTHTERVRANRGCAPSTRPRHTTRNWCVSFENRQVSAKHINRKVPPCCSARTNIFGRSNEGFQILEHHAMRVTVANQRLQGTVPGRSKPLAFHDQLAFNSCSQPSVDVRCRAEHEFQHRLFRPRLEAPIDVTIELQ